MESSRSFQDRLIVRLSSIVWAAKNANDAHDDDQRGAETPAQ